MNKLEDESLRSALAEAMEILRGSKVVDLEFYRLARGSRPIVWKSRRRRVDRPTEALSALSDSQDLPS